MLCITVDRWAESGRVKSEQCTRSSAWRDFSASQLQRSQLCQWRQLECSQFHLQSTRWRVHGCTWLHSQFTRQYCALLVISTLLWLMCFLLFSHCLHYWPFNVFLSLGRQQCWLASQRRMQTAVFLTSVCVMLLTSVAAWCPFASQLFT